MGGRKAAAVSAPAPEPAAETSVQQPAVNTSTTVTVAGEVVPKPEGSTATRKTTAPLLDKINQMTPILPAGGGGGGDVDGTQVGDLTTVLAERQSGGGSDYLVGAEVAYGW